MGHSKTILVLGVNHKSDLEETLFNLGFIPIFRKDILPALEILRHDRFKLVIMDLRSLNVDVLEFILNVRDVNSRIPVLVLGDSKSSLNHQDVLDQLNTFILIPKTKQLRRQLNTFFKTFKEIEDALWQKKERRQQ